MESLCPLFVFKVLLERVLLVDDTAMLVGVPLSARVQFLDVPLETVSGGAALHSKTGVTFQGFPERKTPPFYSDATAMLRSLQRQPLSVTLFQQHPAAPLPVVLGAASVPVADAFTSLLVRANKCAPRHPLAAVVRDEYAVLDAGKVDVQVGTVSLSVRLVCFDGQALEQMRADKVRAAEASASAWSSSPAVGTLTPRRSSHPCADDKMVTPATDTCSKCMLPKRPPSTHRHAHHREPSQATILEESNGAWPQDPTGRHPSVRPAPPEGSPPTRARSQRAQQRSEGAPAGHQHPPGAASNAAAAQDEAGDTSATTAGEKPQRAAKDAERAALASTVCAAVPSPMSSASAATRVSEKATAGAGQQGDSSGLVKQAEAASRGADVVPELAGQGLGGDRQAGVAGARVDGGDARASSSGTQAQHVADGRVLGALRPATPRAAADTAGTHPAPGAKAAKPATETRSEAKHAVIDGSPSWAAGGTHNVREMCAWVGETHLVGQTKGRPQPARQVKLPDLARDVDSIAANFRRLREGRGEGRPRVIDLEMNLSAPLRRYGHTDCVVPPKLVPANQGWLWCSESSADQQARYPYPVRRGWYPGAIPRGLRLRPTRSDGADPLRHDGPDGKHASP